MAWYTVANVVSRAARELGLVSANISDPYASTDANVLQLTSLLEALGQDLCRQYDFDVQRREATLTTVASTPGYALPEDFLRFAHGTAWNRTQTIPVPAISPQDWQQVKANTTAGLIYKQMRLYGGKLYLIDTPSAAETIVYEYQSRFWVRRAITGAWTALTAYVIGNLVTNDSGKVYYCDTNGTSAASGGPTGTTANQTDGTARWDYYEPSVDSIPTTLEAPTLASDVLMLDLRLLVSGLKLAFRRAKGLDTAAEQQDFDRSLAFAQGVGAHNSLTVGRSNLDFLVGAGNAPDTGFGS